MAMCDDCEEQPLTFKDVVEITKQGKRFQVWLECPVCGLTQAMEASVDTVIAVCDFYGVKTSKDEIFSNPDILQGVGTG